MSKPTRRGIRQGPGEEPSRRASRFTSGRRWIVLPVMVAVVVSAGCAGRTQRLTEPEMEAFREAVASAQPVLVSYTASWHEAVTRGEVESPSGTVRESHVWKRWGTCGHDPDKQILIRWGPPSVTSGPESPWRPFSAVWSNAEGVFRVSGALYSSAASPSPADPDGRQGLGGCIDRSGLRSPTADPSEISPRADRRSFAQVNIRPPDGRSIRPPVYDVRYWLGLNGRTVGQILTAGTTSQSSSLRDVTVSLVTHEGAPHYKISGARRDTRIELLLDPARGYQPVRITHRRSNEPLPCIETDITLSKGAGDVWYPSHVSQRFYDIDTTASAPRQKLDLGRNVWFEDFKPNVWIDPSAFDLPAMDASSVTVFDRR